ncbi:MAG TPA: ABC transporter permease [Candidatus Onthovicinus excrementipullorum]|nr:ABC transporter permease [Candidatus Onthovicinus excrementipullorum]
MKNSKKKVSVKYLTKEGFRNVWHNKLMSIASVAVLMSCMIIIGCAALVFANINKVLDKVDDQNVIVAFIDDGAAQDVIDRVGADLKALPNVGSVTFVSQEEGLAQMAEEMDLSDYLNGMENPLPDSYKITVDDMALFDQTAESIRNVDGIQSIEESSDLAGSLTTVRHAVSIVSIVIIAMLFVVSLFIVSNTVRVTMYSRRLEISIMKAVGATRWFIRWPFMIEGMLIGLLAGILSLLAVWGVYALAVSLFGDMFASLLGGVTLVPFADLSWKLLLAFVAIGIVTGGVGSIFSMNKYLREEEGVVQIEK